MKFYKSVLVALILFSCNKPTSEFEINEAYLAEFEDYWAPKPDMNYLPLVGLFQIKPMQANTFGSASTNNFQMNIESMPESLGSYSIIGDSITYFAPDSLEVSTEEGEQIKTYTYPNLNDAKSKKLRSGSFYWFLHEVAGRIYLRVGDNNNPRISEFEGYIYYPPTAEFIFNANYQPFTQPKKAFVPTIFDYEYEMTFIGTVSFTYKGQEYEIEVCEGGFLMFSDETSAIETYGSGRYLDLNLPENGGEFLLDFNLAYNPPCSYSEFTVCKFPTEDNRLPFRITAGEKMEQH